MTDTDKAFQQVLDTCRNLFAQKLIDYGVSWRILRIPSLTDQIYIKACRIRTLEETGVSMVREGILPEYIAIVNYGIIGLIQLSLGYSNTEDLTPEEALDLYDRHAHEALSLMLRKNHDYNEAWRSMRMSSYVDMILMKLYRTKQIEDNGGETIVSEGIDANYMDMINYAVFALIKLQATDTDA